MAASGLRRGLDRAQVVAAAAKIADRDGIAAVGLATVARELGVRSPSLYSHVDGLADLIRGMQLLALSELTGELRGACVGRAGPDALRALADAFRAYAQAHPGRYATIVVAPEPDDAELQAQAQATIAVFTAVLAGWGLEGEPAIHAVRGLRAAMHGFVTIEAAGGFGLPLDLDVSFAQLVETLIDGLCSAADRARAAGLAANATSAAG